MPHRILVTGATGNQGGAVLRALFDLDNSSTEIFALTRDANSPRARNLAARYTQLRLVSGTYDDPKAIFTACGNQIDAVFAVQLPVGFPPSAEAEERHGIAFIDAAIANGVKVFVQTTVDRGVNSDTNPTKVPHYTRGVGSAVAAVRHYRVPLATLSVPR